MRYSSEVALGFTKKGHDFFLQELEKQSEKVKQNFPSEEDELKIKKSLLDESIFYYWESIRWNFNTPFVKFIEDFLNKLANEITKKDFLYVYFGEECYEDVELDENDDFLIIGEFMGDAEINPFYSYCLKHV